MRIQHYTYMLTYLHNISANTNIKPGLKYRDFHQVFNIADFSQKLVDAKTKYREETVKIRMCMIFYKVYELLLIKYI